MAVSVQVTVANEAEVLAVGWGQRSLSSSGRVPPTSGPPLFETRSVTLTANGRHDHARWAMALEEAKLWKEGVDREVRAKRIGGGVLTSAAAGYIYIYICDYFGFVQQAKTWNLGVDGEVQRNGGGGNSSPLLL